ncbi:HEXXH motif domain-containing protein [Yinghuangia soli]|uniref:HEXXH motif domain-containing protein n=1 Tax=Yinghuangia soli TaxID=2908204 RepID=A0AA41Q981_9ACTN|nr:HEXXH motif domain-containing protein [Yinghuangia soli]MCF2528907.1 HEXXH motif domain-containing protein [Yinghuangia soli]MCF2533561.1 HEXXH motif domain-containing protein [Yinghuangia soli]
MLEVPAPHEPGSPSPSAGSKPRPRGPLPETVLEALSGSGGSLEATCALLDTVFETRMLQVFEVVRAVRAQAAAEPLGAPDDAWAYLEAAQRAEPGAVRGLFLHPQTGLWAAQLLRRLAEPTSDASDAGRPPLWVEAGYLSQLAVSAMLRANLEGTLTVPLRKGTVVLPGLGRLRLGSSAADWDRAVADVHDGRIMLRHGNVTVPVPADPTAQTDAWEPTRILRVEAKGGAVSIGIGVEVDDLGPWGFGDGADPVDRLDTPAAARWQRTLQGAWSVLVRDHFETAPAIGFGVLTVMPLPRAEYLRPRSASTSDAFGCVLMSEPEGWDEESRAVQAAVTLVHEMRHSLLNGLLALTPLVEDHDGLFHAPWRDDPRPLTGILHGAYSFSAVTRFWREQLTRETASTPEHLLAAFEFALWHRQTSQVAGRLAANLHLAPQGRSLVAGLRRDLASWDMRDVPEAAARMAALAARFHASGWRAHHTRVDPALASAYADAWEAGGPASPQGTYLSRISPDPQACGLDALGYAARHLIVSSALHQQGRPAPADPDDLHAADVALLSGDEEAVDLYAYELAEPGARPAAWAGLGLALQERGRPQDAPAAAALLDRPELALSVAELLRRRRGRMPIPLALARWMTDAGPRA